MWLESGMLGVGGADSWQPESLCVAFCTETSGPPGMQETCNKSAATAENAATLAIDWIIERMPMRNSQNQGSNAYSIVPWGLPALCKISVLSS